MTLKKINNSCEDFYIIMGKYFADRSFIKELDCQLYDNNCDWYLLYDGENLTGFFSLEERKKYFYLDNFYVFEPYRNKHFGKTLIAFLPAFIPVRCISRNEYAIKIFKDAGFKEYGKNGRYTKLEREEWS